MPTRVTKLVCVLVLMVTSQICAAETLLQRFDGFGGPVFLEVDKAFKMSSLTSEQDLDLLDWVGGRNFWNQVRRTGFWSALAEARKFKKCPLQLQRWA